MVEEQTASQVSPKRPVAEKVSKASRASKKRKTTTEAAFQVIPPGKKTQSERNAQRRRCRGLFHKLASCEEDLTRLAARVHQADDKDLRKLCEEMVQALYGGFAIADPAMYALKESRDNCGMCNWWYCDDCGELRHSAFHDEDDECDCVGSESDNEEPSSLDDEPSSSSNKGPQVP